MIKANSLQPVPLKDRLQLIDALRGFAFLGILLTNIYAFSGYGWMEQSVIEAIPTYQMDRVVLAVIEILVSTKFITIFSILFGVGFAIQLQRAQKTGSNFKLYFLRRMLVLFLIACIHSYFLWFGDIIRYYAICGMFLVFITHWSSKTILRTAIFFSVFLTAAVFILNGVLQISYSAGYPTRQEIYNAFAYGSFKEAMIMNWRIDSLHNFLRDSPITLVSVFGKILLGYWLGRVGFFQKAAAFRAMRRKWILWGTVIGLPGSIGFWAISSGRLSTEEPWMLPVIFVMAGALVLHSLLYIALFIKFFNVKSILVKSFALVGRMALSNYVLQTILCIIIFYGWFPGFKIKGVGPSLLFLISIAVFTVQVFFSKWWLSRHSMGPLEWIWKKAVYRNFATTVPIMASGAEADTHSSDQPVGQHT
jgi:uncharacterized protein